MKGAMRSAAAPSNLRRASAGFTLLELTVVIIIISLLLSVIAHKSLKIRAEAEWAAVLLNLGNLRSALGMHVAKQVSRGDFAALHALDGANPMDLALRPPPNYAGERPDAEAAAIEPRTWYFDPEARALVYRLEFTDGFTSPLDGPARVRFRLQVFHTEPTGPGGDSHDGFQGVDLVPVEAFAWRRTPGG